MPLSMTPYEFALEYLNLKVFLTPQELSAAEMDQGGYDPPTGWVTLRADNYRLGHSAWGGSFWNQNVEPRLHKPVKVTVKTIADATVEHIFRSPSEASRFFLTPFLGKGTPEQMQIAIQLLYRFRRVQTSLTHFVERDFIGLDCNGFVGNYYQRVVQNQNWLTANNDIDPGPTTLMNDMLQRQGGKNQINNLSELRKDEIYLLAWCQTNGYCFEPSHDDPTAYGHIMITEPDTLKSIPGGGFSIWVVEATASGKRKLRYLEYIIKPKVTKAAYGTVFNVERGTPSDPMDVRIARLNVPS